MSTERSEAPSSGLPQRSAGIALDAFAALVDASVHAQRIEAMHAAMRVDLISLTVSSALRSEAAFVASSLSPERRRELARRGVTAELATALRVPERTMERLIDEACTLTTELPATLLALRSGDITLQHARVVIDATIGLADDPVLRVRLDERLAEAAATTTAASLRRRARALREELLAESIAERHRAARARRRIEVEPAADGMAWLHALLPAADALLIADRLDRVAAAAAGSVAGSPSGPAADSASAAAPATASAPGGLPALRADAARDLLLHGALPSDSSFAEAASAARPTVHVTVPVLTLMGTEEAPALLDGYGPIDADTARRLAASAPSFTRILTHPVSGTVLDVDRTSYRPPADLKRWLQVRDGTCRFPGCARRAARCEVDHTIDWHDEGRTAFDNLAHLCSLHHHLKHESSWSVRHEPGGTLAWTAPSGRRHVTTPSIRIPGTTPRPTRPDGMSRPTRAHPLPATPPF